MFIHFFVVPDYSVDIQEFKIGYFKYFWEKAFYYTYVVIITDRNVWSICLSYFCNKNKKITNQNDLRPIINFMTYIHTYNRKHICAKLLPFQKPLKKFKFY